MNRWKCVVFAALVAACVSGTAAYAQSAAPRSYYVRANGDDENNNGRSEDAPFKTLAKAVDAAKRGVIKRITVLGKIEIGSLDIRDAGADEILVTGKPDAAEGEKAELTIRDGVRVSNAKVWFIQVSLSRINVGRGGNVTLGAGTLVSSINVENGNITMTDDAVTSGISCSGDTQITMSDNATITGGKGIVGRDENRTTITMSGNARIVNNTSDNSGGGGGIYAYPGVITMSDNAEISGNTSKGSGGGIYMFGGTLTMSGNARIINNTARVNGGGIVAWAKSVITISDNAQINGNTANNSGGGIYVNAAGVITTISDNAHISGNIASNSGGGIYSSGKVTINGGEISGNTAKNGGGVFTTQNSEGSMSGGTITGNKAEYGAGVFVGKGSGAFTLKGGSITGNEAEFVGGGVYVETGATYTADGGTVTDNTAGDGGSNVFRQQ